jgi:hypothetical protein
MDLPIEPIDLPLESSRWARRRRLQVRATIGGHIGPTVRRRRKAEVARAVRRTFDHLGARFQQRTLDSDGMVSAFDRSTFLLGEQLEYFERYGKMYTPDLPLLWDPAVFEKLLTSSAVSAA